MPWTVILIIATTIVFFLQLIFSALKIPFTELLAITPAFVLSRPWTLVTPIFLHGSFFHLFLNMFVLWMFGVYLEKKIGSQKFLILYFAAGILGNIGYAITASNPLIPGLGASGAIFGILGTLAILEPNLMIFVWMVPMPLWIAAFLFIIFELGMSFAGGDMIAHWAHLFGLFFGFVYGYYLRKKTQKEFIIEF